MIGFLQDDHFGSGWPAERVEGQCLQSAFPIEVELFLEEKGLGFSHPRQKRIGDKSLCPRLDPVKMS